MFSGVGGFVLASAGGSSRLVASSNSFAGFETVGESCNVLCSAEADARLVTVPVVSLGKDCDGGCDAGAGARGCTSGMEIFGATLILLARGVGSDCGLFFAFSNILSRRS